LTISGLRLRHLSFHGPNRRPASVEFGPGLNVIYGASDTGKSFIVEAIDFMLGGRPPIREIRERIGYDRILLAMETLAGESFTVQRSVDGGAFRAYTGLHSEPPGEQVESKDLSDQHSDRNPDNLSSYLLERCGLAGKRVRRNKAGQTNSLSFRHLARLVIVNETEIIEPRSPLRDGNPINDTPNFATFKLLLTGLDDSALTTASPASPEHQSREAQMGLLDQLLDDYRARLNDLTGDPNDLEGQLDRLEASIGLHVEQLGTTESEYRERADRRGDLRKRLEEGRERRAEVNSLVARFSLLDRHYASDLARLRGLEEGGTLFEVMGQGPCPLCGADPEHHRRNADSVVNVAGVVEAARSEIAKIEVLRRELAETVEGLIRERTGFDRRLPRLEQQVREVSDQVDRLISPKLARLRASYKEFADKRGEVREALSVLRTIQDIERRRTALENGSDGGVESAVSDGDLPVAVAEEFSQGIETILTAWHFPETGRVYFDAKSRDLVIAAKHRGARGKGLRAVTHAAFTLGILEFCRKNETSHPGFVMLDSPLLAYREPEGTEEDLIGTDLKDQFYSYLSDWPEDRQVVIVENTDPPEAIRGRPQVIFFSKNPHSGRYGFFPAAEPESSTGNGTGPEVEGSVADA
jgi:AAA domain-containing protein